MRTLERHSVSSVMTQVPGIARTLREYHIDPTNRMLLSEAAAAASTSVDELLAVAEVRMRRAAKAAHPVHNKVEEYEYEFA